MDSCGYDELVSKRTAAITKLMSYRQGTDKFILAFQELCDNRQTTFIHGASFTHAPPHLRGKVDAILIPI